MLKQQLQKHFWFNTFLKGQEAVIGKVLERQSAAAIFPTGAGKSLCYQLPAMLLPGMTLVVSPPAVFNEIPVGRFAIKRLNFIKKCIFNNC